MADQKLNGSPEFKMDSKAEPKTDTKKRISPAQFYYENRDTKTKVRHWMLRFRDKFYIIRRYGIITEYLAMSLGFFLLVHFGKKIKYGFDTPVSNIEYYWKKQEGTLKEEHLKAEERLKFVIKARRENDARHGAWFSKWWKEG